MKDHIIAVTEQKVIIEKIDIDTFLTKSTITLTKQDILMTEYIDETFKIHCLNGTEYTFKEMPSSWGNSLKNAIDELTK